MNAYDRWASPGENGTVFLQCTSNTLCMQKYPFGAKISTFLSPYVLYMLCMHLS